jgi:uncharacterized protein (DUF1501 family)
MKLLEGWLGRYFSLKLPNFPTEIPEHPLSISIDGTIPLMFRSDKGHMGIALTDPNEFYQLGLGLTPSEPLMAGVNYYEEEFNFVHAIAQQSEVYSVAVKNAFDDGKELINGELYSSNGLSQKMKLISSLIAGGLKTKVYFMKLSNFDSHAQQANADFTGQHYTLLNDMAKAITEFMEDAAIGGYAERITGMTISEFGRRAYDNGSRGTDHGAASMQFIWGHDKYVNGGYWNNRPKLTDLDINGNVKYQTDYRVIFTEFLEKRLGATPADVTDVFGESFLPLNILEARTSSAEEYLKKGVNEYVNVYPNPSHGNGLISFELFRGGFVNVSIYNVNGKEVAVLQNGPLPAGIYELPYSIDKSGAYVCSVSSGHKRYNTKFIITR